MKRIIIPAIAFLLLALLFAYGLLLYPQDSRLPSGNSLEAPSVRHWLGTDNLGIDIFAQISNGFFHSLSIGLSTAMIAFLLGEHWEKRQAMPGAGWICWWSFLSIFFSLCPNYP